MPPPSQHPKKSRIPAFTFTSCSLDDILQVVSQGWKYFKGNFYYFSLISKTWYSAEQFCVSRNSHLTSVTSESEQVSAVPMGSVKGAYEHWAREDGQDYTV